MRTLVLALTSLLVAAPVADASVKASATRVSSTVLRVTVQVKSSRSTGWVHVEGCADYGCGGGAGIDRKVRLRRGRAKVVLTVSNMAQHFEPPPLGTTEAWDAWAYRPAQTDVASVGFTSSNGAWSPQVEVRPN
jgi:hypothetical protein